MLRAGIIRRLATGLYSWLPMGLRTLRKWSGSSARRWDRAGALELIMPVFQPAELWQESGRWEAYGPELLRIKDRHKRDYVAGPTHEEVITDIARRELKSYRQLPVNFYQIQTKFRDEVRPRFGVMRAREFIMKDAYSFHIDEASLKEGYRTMYDAYTRIFTRTGLNFRAVKADSGAIGGDVSQEFHVLASSGEDAIAFSDNGDYAANLEAAVALPPALPRPPATLALQKVSTPGVRTIEELSKFPPGEARGMRKDAAGGWRRGWRRGPGGSRRSRTECRESPETGGRQKPPPDGQCYHHQDGHWRRARLPGSGRTARRPLVCRSQRFRDCGLRRGRQ